MCGDKKEGEMEMKSKAFLALAMLGLLIGAVACGAAEGAKDADTPGGQVPPAPNKYVVVVTAEDFGREAHVLRQVEVNAGQVFTIALDSNVTTGFQWTEQANIADTAILKQTAHSYIAPRAVDDQVTGMSGIEEWTFAAGQTGTTTMTLRYSRPWAGGEKDVRTFELTAVVK